MQKTVFTPRLVSMMFCAIFQAGVTHADTGLPAYTPAAGVSGTVVSVGSDTMVYLVSFWAVAFKKLHPQVKIRIAQAGSATAPPALISGESSIGPMSRRMNEKELVAFEASHGYRPTEIRVALDTLAVYVNRKNQLGGLSLPQVDTVFSDTRRCGGQTDAVRWGQVGAVGDWADRDIQLYGRNLISGTHAFFKDHALCKGSYRKSLEMKPTSMEVVNAVLAKPYAIGYSGIGYLRPGVRALPLAARNGEAFVEATPENARNGRYPLTRFMYVYVNKLPGKPMPVLEKEFLRFMLSAGGQDIVTNDGFISLTADQVRGELAKLE